MEIRTVSIIGLGALGTLFGHLLSKAMAAEDLRVIADRERIGRYGRDGVFCNGEPCFFNYVTPEEPAAPADLLLVAVKYSGLDDAITAAAGHVGTDTVILSLLNGITSEDVLGRAFGREKVLLCVAQGMDAVREDHRLTYRSAGLLSFGGREPGAPTERVLAVARFFKKTGVPHEVVSDMKRRLWSKFMINVGVNQTTAVYRCDYAGVQKPGPYRDTMIAAMREVAALSEKEGVRLTDEDVAYWLNVVDTINPLGKTSMQQDIEARRKTEVGIFSGAVLELGRKHGLPCPVNEMLYARIRALEGA